MTSRCTECRKKLGILEYKCKCDKVFCITHLAYEAHSCSYDYKTSSKKELENSLNIGKLGNKFGNESEKI